MPKAPEPSSTCQKTTKSLPRISPKSYCYNAVPNRFSSRFSTSRTNGPRSLSRTKGCTHSAFREKSHTAAHTAKHGVFPVGALLLPSDCFTRFRNPAWPGGRAANFAAFGSWSEALLKDTKSLRDSDALMRVAVPRRRGPAGLRDLFRFCRNCGLYILRSGLSACARHGRYHYPWCALHVLETPDGRLSKRLTCRFLRSGGRSSPHDFYFLANMQVSLSENSVATTFALWYNKSKELEEFQNNYAV